MLDHIILTVSDVERSLKFYTAALKPLKIKMSEPYKGADGHPDLWGFGDGQKTFFWLKRVSLIRPQSTGALSQKTTKR